MLYCCLWQSRASESRGRQPSYDRMPGTMEDFSSRTRGPAAPTTKDGTSLEPTSELDALANPNGHGADSLAKRERLAYLQLAKGNAQEAAARMASTARWRQDEGVHQWLQQPVPPRTHELRAVVTSGFCGWAAGREAAVWWHFPGAPHSQLKRLWANGHVSPRELLKHHLYLLEYALRALPAPQPGMPSPADTARPGSSSSSSSKTGSGSRSSSKHSSKTPTAAKAGGQPLSQRSSVQEEVGSQPPLLEEPRQVLAVVDLSGLELGDFLGPGLDFLQALAATLGNHYPGSNGGLVLVNAPSFWSLAAAIVLPLLGEHVVAQKLQVFGSGWRSDPAFLALLDLSTFGGNPNGSTSGRNSSGGGSSGGSGVPSTPAEVQQSAEEAHFAAWLRSRPVANGDDDDNNSDTGENLLDNSGLKSIRRGEQNQEGEEGDEDDFYNSTPAEESNAAKMGSQSGSLLEDLLEVRVGPAGDWVPRLVRVLNDKKELQLAPPGAEDEDEEDLDDTASVASKDTARGRAASRFAGRGSERFPVVDLSSVVAESGGGGDDDGDDSQRVHIFSFFAEGDMFEFSCKNAVEVQAWVGALHQLQSSTGGGGGANEAATSELAPVRRSGDQHSDNEEDRQRKEDEEEEGGDEDVEGEEEKNNDDDGGVAKLLVASDVPALAYPLAMVHEVKLDLNLTQSEIANAVGRANNSSGSGSAGASSRRSPPPAPASSSRDRDRSGSSPRSVSAASTTASVSTASPGSDNGSLNSGGRDSNSGGFPREKAVSQSMPRPSPAGSGERPSVSLPGPDAPKNTSPRAYPNGRRGSSPRAVPPPRAPSPRRRNSSGSKQTDGNDNASGLGQGHNAISNNTNGSSSSADAYVAANPEGTGWPLTLGGASFVLRRRLRSDARLEVSAVAPGSAAAKCGLRVGDIVVQAGGSSEGTERVLREQAATVQAHLQAQVAKKNSSSSSDHGSGSGRTMSSSSVVDGNKTSASSSSSRALPPPGSSSGSGSASSSDSSANSTPRAPPGPKRTPPPQPRSRGGSASRDSVHAVQNGTSSSTRGATEPRPDTSFRSRSRDSIATGDSSGGSSSSGVRSGSKSRSSSSANRSPPLPPLSLKVWRLVGAASPSLLTNEDAAGHSNSGNSSNADPSNTAAPVRCFGTDICVSIDAETRGMHVQQTNDEGPIVVVGATGDAAIRGMRRGDVLVGVHHIPFPPRATLQHVQQLMESLPRPLSLNLYRPSPFDRPAPVQGDSSFPLPLQAKLWVQPGPLPERSDEANDDHDTDEYYRGVSPPVVSSNNNNNNSSSSILLPAKARTAGLGESFFIQVVRAHKGYVLTELHHKEDPDSARLDALVL